MHRMIRDIFPILILTSLSSVGTGQEDEFKCKPRVGCHIPRCDPGPIDPRTAEWNEYPISCVGSLNKTSRPVITRREYSALLNLYGGQRRTINSLKKEIPSLQENVTRLEKVIRLNGRRWNKTQLSMADVRQKVSGLREENDEIRKELEEMRKANLLPVQPPSGIERLERSVQNILASLKGLREENRKLEKELDKLKAQKDTSTVPPTTSTTTRSRAPIRNTGDNCELAYGGDCFFLLLRNRRDLNFKTAQEECSKLEASSAVITSEQSYRAVMDFMRRKVTSVKLVWTGMLYDPVNKKLIKSNAFAVWAPGAPLSNRESRTIVIRVTPTDDLDGMINISAYAQYDAVLCQN